MSYKVKITWQPTTAQSAVEQLAETIGGRLEPEKSYVQTEMFKDTPYYSEAPDGTIGTGSSEEDENTMHKGVLLAFKAAIENGEHSIELTGISAKDALYFEELGYPMGEQGFTIEVEQESGGEHPVEVKKATFNVLSSYEDYGKEDVDWFVFKNEGDTFHLVRVCEDYFPTETPEKGCYILVDEDGEQSVTSFYATSSGENVTMYAFGGSIDALFLVGVTDADGGTLDMENIHINFPSGGMWSIYEMLNGAFSSLSISILKEEIKSIEIKTMPTKTGYFVGDSLDLTGISVTATYALMDGQTEVETGTETIYEDDCTFSPESGTTLSTAGDMIVTTTYEGKTTTLSVYAIETTDSATLTWDGQLNTQFTLLDSKPTDWENVWPRYFESDGNGGFKPAGPTTWNDGYYPNWSENTYYYANDLIHFSGNRVIEDAYFKVLDGVVPDPREQVSSIDATFGGSVISGLTIPSQSVYEGDNFWYSYASNDCYVICTKKPDTSVTLGGSHYPPTVFANPGTYFLWRRLNNVDHPVYTEELKFNK